jgi:hypothetical protein
METGLDSGRDVPKPPLDWVFGGIFRKTGKDFISHLSMQSSED